MKWYLYFLESGITDILNGKEVIECRKKYKKIPELKCKMNVDESRKMWWLFFYNGKKIYIIKKTTKQ